MDVPEDGALRALLTAPTFNTFTLSLVLTEEL